ncbi:MAG: hypothetical protein WD076_04255, partial [Parvularculaceae bacterium]
MASIVNSAAMMLNDRFADVEAEAGAASLARVGRIRLRKSLENSASELFLNSGPAIDDRHAHFVAED